MLDYFWRGDIGFLDMDFDWGWVNHVLYGIELSSESLALSSILIPSGWVDWRYEHASLEKRRFLSVPGVLRLDFHGPNSPQPAAHRLFFTSDQLGKFLPVVGFLVRECVDRAEEHAEDLGWRSWAGELITHLDMNVVGSASASLGDYSNRYVLRQEGQHIIDSLGLLIREDSVLKAVSIEELRERWDGPIPLLCNEGVAGDGLVGYRWDDPNRLFIDRAIYLPNGQVLEAELRE